MEAVLADVFAVGCEDADAAVGGGGQRDQVDEIVGEAGAQCVVALEVAGCEGGG